MRLYLWATMERIKASDYEAVRSGFDIPALKVYSETQKSRGFGLQLIEEGTVVLGIDATMNTVEFFDDAAQAEGREIPSQHPPPG